MRVGVFAVGAFPLFRKKKRTGGICPVRYAVKTTLSNYVSVLHDQIYISTQIYNVEKRMSIKIVVNL